MNNAFIDSLKTKFSTIFLGFMVVLVSLFSIFNAFSGLVSGVWLLFIGQWRFVLAGFISLLLSSFALSLCFMPGILIAAAGAWLGKHKLSLLGMPIIMVSFIYTQLVTVFWMSVVLYFGLIIALMSSPIPVLVYSYAIAVAPFALFAKRERTQEAHIAAVFINVAYLFVMLKVLLFKSVDWALANLANLQITMFIICCIPVLLRLVESSLLAYERRKLR